MALRVLHCPTDTGGNAWTLSRAERELGLVSDVMVLSSTWLGYPADVDLGLSDRGRLRKATTLAGFLTRAARDYDVINFNFGSTILSGLAGLPRFLREIDLPYFRRCGKGIVVTYQGCDVRQRSYCVEHFEVSACDEAHCGLCTLEVDRERRRRASLFDRYADAIFALNPDLLRVLPERAEFLPYTTVDVRAWRSEGPAPGQGDRFRVLHAPTSRSIKGTEYVMEAVARVQRVCPEVELLTVEGVPHSQVKEHFRRADILVDQLLVGWYGGLAVELMALGRPVMCHIREQDLRFVPRDMAAELPIVNVTTDSLYSALLELAEDRERVRRLGLRSREYVERWHDPLKIAQQTRRVYERAVTARRRGRNASSARD